VLIASLVHFGRCEAPSDTRFLKPAPATQPNKGEPGLTLGTQTYIDSNGLRGARTVYMAFIRNDSAGAVRVYTPGFVGPVLKPPFEFPESIGLGVLPFGDDRDFVTLRPGESWGYSHIVDEERAPEKRSRASCHYTVYREGREGHQDAIVRVLYSTGQER
jgi:hypothetical protein